jgi:hypothetical protein
MTKGFDGVRNSNIAQLSTVAMPDSAVTSNMLAIVAEVTDYSKQYLDNRAAFVEKLLGAKSFDSAVRIQSEYAKTSFEGIVAQATKMGELYSNLAKLAFKPFGGAIANSQVSAETPPASERNTPMNSKI